MEALGRLLDCRTRQYLNPREDVRIQDLLSVVETGIAWAISEAYLAIIIPSLGLVSGSPCPWAAYTSRWAVFAAGPLCYVAMYLGVCGCIHYLYTRRWPEEGKKLSIQGKPMSDEALRKAVVFSLKSITTACGISCFFYYAMKGWTAVHWGMPRPSELPWIVLGYLLVDISAFLVHRALHRPWLYARIHKVHHLWKSPNAFVVSALHPTEFLALAVPTCAILTSLPLSFPVLVLVFMLIFVCNAMDHSGLHLEGTVLSRLLFWQAHPDFHDNHHAYFHANYGAMVDWWDRLGGTYYNPKAHGQIGVGESQFASVRELQIKAQTIRAGG